MKKFEAYIEDGREVIEFEDEMIFTNLHAVTFVKSLREIKCLKDKGIDCSEIEEKNNWLYDLCNKIESISTISFDQLKLKINAEYKSCDCFFYNAQKSEDKLSLLMEFKNDNRSGILEYLKSEDNDSLLAKVKDSINMLKHDIEFDDGFTGSELIQKTHFVIVYGGRADTPSNVSLGFGKKNVVKRNTNGRQERAVFMNRNQETDVLRKKQEEVMELFGRKIQSLKLSPCAQGYFGIPVNDPKVIKFKGVGKLLYYTMITKHDFADIVNKNNYFDSWNWGKYECFNVCDANNT